MADVSKWLEEAKARCEAATEGPWFYDSYAGVCASAKSNDYQLLEEAWVRAGEPEEDPGEVARRDGTSEEYWAAMAWHERFYAAEPLVATVPAFVGDTAKGRHQADAIFIEAARTDLPRALRIVEAAIELRRWMSPPSIVNICRDPSHGEKANCLACCRKAQEALAAFDAEVERG